MEAQLLAGVEAGGTTFVVALARRGTIEKLLERTVFPTSAPEETLARVVQWLKEQSDKHGAIAALGIACFGPVDLNPSSATYGYITTTPKPGWRNTNVLGAFEGFDCPKAFETDVNAPALAQMRRGNHRTCAYITVGTGVGVGLVVEGKPVHGLLHPELGHMYVPRGEGDTFEGTCPFHKNCVEGMVAIGALSKRLGCKTEDLPQVSDENEVWQHVAFYLAQLCVTLILSVSPQVIVLGGGVMKRQSLFPSIRRNVVQLLQGYINVPAITEGTEEYIIPSPFGPDAGIIGALEIADIAFSNQKIAE